jgi:predicted dinucleotide-binding enzyme
MAYKTFASMNIAIIGDGKVGETLARKLACVDHNIFIGIKNEFTSISEDFFNQFDNVALTSIEYAAAVADIIIIATPANEVREAAYLLDDVRHKVIVDMSGFNLNHDNYFHTANAIHAITYSPYVVKCFSDKGYNSLLSPFSLKRVGEVHVAGDSKKAKEIVKLLVRDMGFVNCHDLGGNENIAVLDSKLLLEQSK